MLRVLPEGARPGILVTVAASQPAFPDGAKTRVELGGQPAQLVRWISPTEVEVLVPNVAAGTARMEVSGGKATSSTQFEVLPAAAQELVLKMADGKLELIAARPTGDEPDTISPSGEPQLSYDVVTPEGAVVFTGAIRHPTQASREVFDGSSAEKAILRREPPHAAAASVFALKVPALPGATVRLYESAAGTNLRDARSRDTRKLVGEIILER